MNRYLTYLSYVIRHKWFVFLECCKTGIIWQGITHDLSKFLPNEFFPYARHDWSGVRDKTGYYKPTYTGDKAFNNAWLRHIHRNRHHWQYWILVDDFTVEKGKIKILEMPEKYIKEMICDWKGAGRAQHNPTSCREWYQYNKYKMQLHPKTRDLLEEKLLKELKGRSNK